MANDLIGDGAVLSYATNLTTPVYTVVDGVISVDGPGISADTIDTPLLASTFKTKRVGKPGGEDGSITMGYDGDNPFHEVCLDWLAANAPTVRFKLLLEDTSTIVWDGAVTSWKPSGVELGGRIEIEVGFTVNSIPVITAPA
jgi:hypothetical protein